jgi:hypothetical protein
VDSIDIVACNPPYMRFAKLGDFHKALYRAIVPGYAQGDLLFSFLDKLSAILKPNGIFAAVTSDRWLSNDGASRLRAAIGAKFGISHLRRLDCASAFYRAKTRRKGTPPRVHPVAIVLSPAAPIPMGLAPINIGNPMAAPAHGRTLADICEIRLAPWLGPDGIFVVGADVAATMPQGRIFPCVNAKTIDMQARRLRPITRWVIATTRDDALPESIRAHLDATRERMPPRGQRNMPWLPPEQFVGRFPLTEEALLIPRIAKSICPIRLPAGIVPVDHQLTVLSGGIPINRLEAMLGSPEAHAWLQDNVPAIDGGYYNIRTGLLRRLPVFEKYL